MDATPAPDPGRLAAPLVRLYVRLLALLARPLPRPRLGYAWRRSADQGGPFGGPPAPPLHPLPPPAAPPQPGVPHLNLLEAARRPRPRTVEVWVGPSREHWEATLAELAELRRFAEQVAVEVKPARWVEAEPRPGEYRVPLHRQRVVVGARFDAARVSGIRLALSELGRYQPRHLAAA